MARTGDKQQSLEDVAPGMDLPEGVLAELARALTHRDAVLISRLFDSLHPADAADLIEQLSWDQQKWLAELDPDVLTGETLAELGEDTRAQIMELLEPHQIVEALDGLDSDDKTMVVEELQPEMREAVLSAVPRQDREHLEHSLGFGEETAGRLMQREFVAAPQFWTVGHTIDHMRRTGEALPDLFFEVFIVDEGFRPIGATPVSRLMRSQRDTLLSDIMAPVTIAIRPEDDQEDAAYLFQKYHLISAPVVDEAGRLKGMLTVDDIVNVIQEENKEDLLALAGVGEAGPAYTVLESVKVRAPWLLVNLATAVLASMVIALFDQAIAQWVALAVLMPIVASMGGNAGTQSLAVAVRALATRDLTGANSLRFVWRESAVGVVNGLIFAVVMGLVAALWFGKFDLAWVIAIAMVINLAVAGLAGVLVPLGLKRFGADPAVASSVFVTTVTDIVGFLAFLGLGALVLL